MFKIEKSSAGRTARKRVGSALLALALATGGLAVTATAAQAAPLKGCSVSPGVPKKDGSNISGSGSGTCTSDTTNRTFIYQIHRSQGFTHPNVAQAQQSGKKKAYKASAKNCDVGSGTAKYEYFGQAFFKGYDASLSGNTAKMVICG